MSRPLKCLDDLARLKIDQRELPSRIAGGTNHLPAIGAERDPNIMAMTGVDSTEFLAGQWVVNVNLFS